MFQLLWGYSKWSKNVTRNSESRFQKYCPIANIINFDSSFVGRIVTLKYVSDGLGDDEDLTIHKFAEEALYKYIAHAILATRANTPEYLVMRFKKELATTRRNTKLRLSNIKIEEIAQVMRNKSKIIKH